MTLTVEGILIRSSDLHSSKADFPILHPLRKLYSSQLVEAVERIIINILDRWIDFDANDTERHLVFPLIRVEEIFTAVVAVMVSLHFVQKLFKLIQNVAAGNG